MKRLSECQNFTCNNRGEVRELATGQECPHILPFQGGCGAWIATVLASVGETDLLFMPHPYEGLKDMRNWLTRYPAAICTLPRQWMAEFIAFGGTLDAAGVWGISPEEKYLSALSPKIIARLLSEAHCGRWDNVANMRHLISNNIPISEDISLLELKILAQGQKRSFILRECGAATETRDEEGRVTCHVCGKAYGLMSLGWMRPEKYHFLVAQYATRWPEKSPVRPGGGYALAKTHFKPYHGNLGGGDFFGVSVGDVEYFQGGQAITPADEMRGVVTSPIFIKFVADRKKYAARHQRQRAAWDANPQRTQTLHSRRAFEWALKNAPSVYDTYSTDHACRPIRRRIHSLETSAGKMFYSGDLVALVAASGSDGFLSTRVCAGYRVAKAGETCFAWQSGNFKNHAEGRNIKEAIRRLESRKELKGNSLSLKMIHDHKSWCLSGVKGFLWHKMPHVARLIQNTASWEEIPQEIAEIKWELASREIFAGYPQP